MHYRRHVFCCVNTRDLHHLRGCCSARGSEPLRAYMKLRAKELKLDDVRINNAGCLERCELGPTMVIYPEGIWYHYDCVEDIDEILEKHVVGGEIVERLRLPDGVTIPEIYPQEYLNLVVKNVNHAGDDVILVDLENATDDALPNFRAGAHIDLIVEKLGTRRSYSLLTSSAGGGKYEIGIVREDSGRGGSQWLHGNLKRGALIKSSRPHNNISIVDSAKQHLLIAVGKGIVSMIGVMRYLAENGADFDVHYFGESHQHGNFIDLAQQLCNGSVNLYGGTREGLAEFCRSELLQPLAGTKLIFSGSAEAFAVVKPNLEHWPENSVQFQIIGVPQQPEQNNRPFKVYLSRQRKLLRVAAHQSIAQALRSLGVASHNFCEDSLCGACWTRVLHGEFECDDLTGAHQIPEMMKICKGRAREISQKLILDI